MIFHIANYMDDLSLRIWLLERNIDHSFEPHYYPFYKYKLTIPDNEDALAFKLHFWI